MHNCLPDPIQIIEYYQDSQDTRHYRFRLLSQADNSQWHNTQPGQFFMLNVPEIGEAPFTFTQPPNAKGEFSALIRKMGKLTRALFDVNETDIIGARGPFGQGWPAISAHERVLIVAGGCGLAPLVDLINRLILQTPRPEIVLIYGARNSQSQMLMSEQQHWGKSMAIYQTLEEMPISQRKDTIATSKYFQQGTPFDVLPRAMASFKTLPSKVLLCGPESMMHAIAQDSVNQGIDASAIYLSVERRMHCAVGLCGHCYIGEQYACKEGPTFSWQTLAQ